MHPAHQSEPHVVKWIISRHRGRIRFGMGNSLVIVSGDVKNTILLFGGSLFIQGLTSLLGMETG